MLALTDHNHNVDPAYFCAGRHSQPSGVQHEIWPNFKTTLH